MSARAKAKEAVAEAEEIARLAAEPPEHLHGTLTACPCGGETGITCVAFPEGWVQPDPCPECGKPVDRFGDTRPARDVLLHVLGCGQHPGTARCVACGGVILATAVFGAGDGPRHFTPECCPGVQRIG
jgi:hypothetical protein